MATLRNRIGNVFRAISALTALADEIDARQKQLASGGTAPRLYPGVPLTDIGWAARSDQRWHDAWVNGVKSSNDLLNNSRMVVYETLLGELMSDLEEELDGIPAFDGKKQSSPQTSMFEPPTDIPG